MAEKRPIKLLNEILDWCVSGEAMKDAPLIFGNLFVTEENRRNFDLAIDDIYDSLSVVSTLSKGQFKDLLLEEIGQQKSKESRFTESEWQSFSKSILGIPIVSWRVFRPIYGVTTPQQGEPVKMGKFIIYDMRFHSARLLKCLPKSSNIFSRMQKGSVYLIECTVDARDSNKALELADRYFIGSNSS